MPLYAWAGANSRSKALEAIRRNIVREQLQYEVTYEREGENHNHAQSESLTLPL